MNKKTIGAFGAALASLPSLVLAQEEEAASGLDVDAILTALNEQVAPWGVKIVGALVALFFGWIVAGWISRTALKAAKSRNLDATLSRFFSNMVRYLVLTAVVLSVLGVFGIETSSFAAIIGAAGLAVGLAFEGTLSNFAAGIMLLVFRPFKIDDVVEAGGTFGVVVEIELFTTTIKTLDNQKIIVPNKAIFGGTIKNIGAYPERRVDIDVGCDYGADIDDCRAALEEALPLIDKALKEPAPQIFLSSLGGSSVDWQVRVWCKTEDYWDVHQSTIRAVKKVLDEKGIGIPFPQMDVHLDAAVVEALGKK